MCLLIAAANMIDKIWTFIIVITLLANNASAAPTTLDHNNDTHVNAENSTSNQRNPTTDSFDKTTSISSVPEPVYDSERGSQNNENVSNTPKISIDKEQIQALSAVPKNSLKARKNNNDLYFCCTEDTVQSATAPTRRNKERERNTKPSILTRGESPEAEAPFFERKPALLLRFFPDGTAVIISKFQLHLHVKPKQIKFEPDDDSTKEEELDFNPGLILNDGKSYEVTYKRLEAIPSSREQNEFDLGESEEKEAYGEDLNHGDHEFITTTEASTLGANGVSTNSESSRESSPLKENDTLTSMSVPETTTLMTSVADEDKSNKTDKVSATVGDSPFFLMTSEEMSSLQQQYDPAVASPLKATTSISRSLQNPDKTVTQQTTTTQVPSTLQTTVTTASSRIQTVPSTSTTKCLSFRNQLSLALSTEDNIDNSLLKRHIFPTQDCNSSDSDFSNSLAKLQNIDTTTKTPQTSLPIITRLPPEPTTTISYTRNNLVPYLASQFSKHPSKPDVVVVTSLPVLIDLKSTRNHPVTAEPSWREVTVGVVRDQQGQPLKPRYNNWATHLRGLRKKTDNKFWNDFTTPKPNFRPPVREPVRQNVQHAPSQINRAFWTDLQRHNQMPDQRNKDNLNRNLYRTNPPRNYPAHNENEFQFLRNRAPNMDNRWNVKSNSNKPDYARVNGPLRSTQSGFGNTENRQSPQWSHGNVLQNNRRW